MKSSSQRTLRGRWPQPGDQESATRLITDFASVGHAEMLITMRKEGRAALAALGGNAPYLAGIVLREPDVFCSVLENGADAVVAAELASLRTLRPDIPRSTTSATLRKKRQRMALAIALADISGAWRLERVTTALSTLAELSLQVVVRHLLFGLHARGAIVLPNPGDPEAGSNFTVIGMGKLGARELNYSSDIDLILLFDPLSPVYRDEAQSAMVRLARDLVPMLAQSDEGGRVFRVDLRLRPDPAATPPVISLAGALAYYESQGRTWERAAFIKARPVAGDVALGKQFLDQIRPFIWRRHLDFAAIAEIREMKRRVDEHQNDVADNVLGRDVKLGRGGIREVEFIVQTLELVWGGQDRSLRVPQTLKGLYRLSRADHMPFEDARTLAAGYRWLRKIEHRLQMVEDRQTHRLPLKPDAFARFAAFMGETDVQRFSARLSTTFEQVHGAFRGLFDAGESARDVARLDPGEEGAMPVAFTETVQGLGFLDVQHVGMRLREWQRGALPALRSERARALLDQILPKLMAALGRQPDPDRAFRRLDQVLSRQRAGVVLLSLFQHNPALLDRLATVLGAAPPLADHMANHPGALDALLGPPDRIAAPQRLLRELLRDARNLEEALITLRGFVRREEFQLSVAMLERRLGADEAGMQRTALADAALSVLLPLVMASHEARYGKLRGGKVGILALGRAGAQEMLPGSDLDLMVIYDHPPDVTVTHIAGSHYFLRLAQTLIASLTAPGAEGPIYAVDMRLRPSGNKGPVAVSLSSFQRYHREEAWTWERLALTRARAVAVTRGFGPVLSAAVREALCRHVDEDTIRSDTRAMRARLARDAAPSSEFDLKHRAGGMMELGFIVEALQLIHGPARPALFVPRTVAALNCLADSRLLDRRTADRLIAADRLFRTVQGMFRITGLHVPLTDSSRVTAAPLLAAAGAVDFADLAAKVDAAAAEVRAAFVALLGPIKEGGIG